MFKVLYCIIFPSYSFIEYLLQFDAGNGLIENTFDSHFKKIKLVLCCAGIFLDYEKGGELRTKSIDLLNLTPE